MGTKTASTYLPYKVKDMALAEYGRREIQLAEAGNIKCRVIMTIKSNIFVGQKNENSTLFY